jgi:pyruvate/2-oxoglutarate dehydrogenase complex dihydrolipoamide acyltransferase (E2) component
MKVKLMQQLECVPDGEVYPKLYRAGEVVDGNVAKAALDQGKGTPADAANDTPVPAKTQAPAAPVGPKEPAPQPGPAAEETRRAPAEAPQPALRAKLNRKVTHKGESYARGIVVEGDLARMFLAEGVADLVPPADKAVTTVPASK